MALGFLRHGFQESLYLNLNLAHKRADFGTKGPLSLPGGVLPSVYERLDGQGEPAERRKGREDTKEIEHVHAVNLPQQVDT